MFRAVNTSSRWLPLNHRLLKIQIRQNLQSKRILAGLQRFNPVRTFVPELIVQSILL
jgi:hypothetical protein